LSKSAKAMGMMKCFVASPLGHEDVDAIYDHGIRPVMRELNLQPIRIDRVEHNDDINNKIFQLLDDADLCIADLTYARPSVYYEAGYAHAFAKPVIFIARKDHFQAEATKLDPNGNLRVHFDLQMKNIIPWLKPDEPFKNQLRRRLLYSLRPLRKRLAELKSASEEEAAFIALPHKDKLLAVADKARGLLLRHKYREQVTRDGYRSPLFLRMTKTEKRTAVLMQIYTYTNLSKKDLEAIDAFGDFITQYDVAWKGAPARKYDLCRVFLCLRHSRQSLIPEVFTSYRRVADSQYEVKSTFQDKPTRFSIIIVDSIKSISELGKRFRTALMSTGYF
jgi:hypothetical protein